MKIKKGYLQISFGWLFAIIAGVFILFLAIYSSTKLIDIEETEIDAKTGKEISILLNPLETGFETGKTISFSLPRETRIYNNCDNAGNFGKQTIQISQKSFNKWTDTNTKTEFENKYIFSENYVEGKKFEIFSKPFEFPFKVADLIYLTSSSDEYCFVESPTEIEEEISALKQKNIFVNNCSEESISVCFDRGNCDINVNYNLGYVEKNSKKMYFDNDALMYAGIFSEKEIYECQIKRLMQRTAQLTILYENKANFISEKGCNSNLNLAELRNTVRILNDSSNIAFAWNIAEEIEEENELAECRLW